MYAHLRMGQAVERQQRDNETVWLTTHTLDIDSGRGVLWYRLGELHDTDNPRQQKFDVGVPVQNIRDIQPEPVEAARDQAHIFISRYPDHLRTRTVNALTALAFVSRRPHRFGGKSLITPLDEKLMQYHLHPVRVSTNQ